MKIRTAPAVLMALASVLLAGCGSDGGTSSADELKGAWRTEPVSVRDAEATLREHGLEKWIERFRPESPIQGDTVLLLELKDEWDLYSLTEDGGRFEVDYDADYKVRGNEVEMIHSDGSTFYEWAVDGDTLTLEWLRTELPGVKGIPEEVFQRVLYMTAEFTRDKS